MKVQFDLHILHGYEDADPLILEMPEMPRKDDLVEIDGAPVRVGWACMTPQRPDIAGLVMASFL